MSTTIDTTHAKPPMTPLRKTALAAGLLYLATFIFSIPAAFGLYDSVLNNPDFVLGGGSSSGVAWGALFEIITALTGIGTAVVLYPVVKRWGQNGAIGFVASRTLEAAMIFVGVLCVMSMLTLRQDLAGTDTTGLATAGHSLLAVKTWTFLLGPGILPAINALCLAPLLLRSRLVPRIIPTIGLIAVPLLLTAAVGVLFGQFDQISAPSALLAAPVAIWELSIGMWMTFKGFKVSPAAADVLVIDEAPVLAGASV